MGLAVFQFVPGDASAAVGVLAALHGEFLAVVDAGRAGHKEQEGVCQLDAFEACAGLGQEAGGVVAPQKVHGDVAAAVGECGADPVAEFLDGNGVLVEEELHDRLAEDVVHDAVELVALQPAGWFVPDFAYDVGLGIDGLYAVAEFLPEGGVVDFVGHVETPAVDAPAGPVFGHGEKVFPNIGAAGVELGERRVIPPAFVIGLARIGVEGPALYMKPVHVRRIFAQFQQAVELEESAGTVVEHAVENDTEA